MSPALFFVVGSWCRVLRINDSSSSTNAVQRRPDVVRAALRSGPSSLSLTLFKDCDTAAAPRRGDVRQPRSIGTLVGLGLALGGGGVQPRLVLLRCLCSFPRLVH